MANHVLSKIILIQKSRCMHSKQLNLQASNVGCLKFTLSLSLSLSLCFFFFFFPVKMLIGRHHEVADTVGFDSVLSLVAPILHSHRVLQSQLLQLLVRNT